MLAAETTDCMRYYLYSSSTSSSPVVIKLVIDVGNVVGVFSIPLVGLISDIAFVNDFTGTNE